jgi:cytochrome P450
VVATGERLPTGEIALTRYAHVATALRDPRFGKPPLPQPPIRAVRALTRQFLLVDPPDHTRLRRVVAPAWTPAAIAAMRPAVETIATRLLADRPDDFDLVRDFAYPLPLKLMGEFLGVPDRGLPKLRAWTSVLTESIDTSPPRGLRDMPRVMGDIAARRWRPVAAGNAAIKIFNYARERIRNMRSDPPSDVMRAVIDGMNSGTLTEDEAAATFVLLLIAGHETSANLIAMLIYSLLRHPDARAAVQHDPALLPGAIEETLRFSTPVPQMARIAHEDVDFDGTLIPAREPLMLRLDLANRDPEVFTDPERFVITRPAKPGHLSFGAGIHFCLGAGLARLEAEVACNLLLPRIHADECADDVTWRPTFSARGPASLPLRLSA